VPLMPRRGPSFLHQARLRHHSKLFMELLHARLMCGITSSPLWKTHKVKNPPATYSNTGVLCALRQGESYFLLKLSFISSVSPILLRLNDKTREGEAPAEPLC
jgi:hypothetical protein